jgi:hypothetical protein
MRDSSESQMVHSRLPIEVAPFCWESNCTLTKPNPSQDGDGKPRVLVVRVDPLLALNYSQNTKDKPTFVKDSRAAERDIVKVTASVARLFSFVSFESLI